MKIFFISREEIKNPLASSIIEAGKKLHECKVRAKSISMRYGKRVLITAMGANVHDLGSEDFVEIVDYNPVGNIMLVIGTKAPPEEAMIHWFIYRREEINAIIYAEGNVEGGIAVDERGNTMEFIAEILRALKKGNLINAGKDVISAGENLQKALEGLKCS